MKRLFAAVLACSMLCLLLSCSSSPAKTENKQPPAPSIQITKVSGTCGDFIRGVDVSSFWSLHQSGVEFYDFDGNKLDAAGFFRFLASCGINWVRLRVWNDPHDAAGNGYGGGNNDLDTAKKLGELATKAGLRVLIDFHYSDFWADPGKQMAPKAWKDLSLEEKCQAIYAYTFECLSQLRNAGVDVGMVQIGNETNGAMCGEIGWENVCALLSSASNAVRNVDEKTLVAVHLTNPEKLGHYATAANMLQQYGVEYDVFASSYYQYWHGTLENLSKQLSYIRSNYNKLVMVVETSWVYTLEDGDGHPNTVALGNNDSHLPYAISPQGQADAITAVAEAVTKAGGIGFCYWEPAWLPVGPADAWQQNSAVWEQFGSGWAASFAGEYDPQDAGRWYGGSAVENQALFDFLGKPLESLKTFFYMQAE